jgi:hypothetical protein
LVAASPETPLIQKVLFGIAKRETVSWFLIQAG